jgi:hypothetical protein
MYGVFIPDLNLFPAALEAKFLWTKLAAYKQTDKQINKLRGLSPRANYTDRKTAACQRSQGSGTLRP